MKDVEEKKSIEQESLSVMNEEEHSNDEGGGV
jgi:hypothetical protein